MKIHKYIKVVFWFHYHYTDITGIQTYNWDTDITWVQTYNWHTDILLAYRHITGIQKYNWYTNI